MAVSTVVVAAGYLIELFRAELGFCRFGGKSIAHWKLPIVLGSGDQTQDGFQCRGFARAIGTKQAENLACRDVKAMPLHR